MQTADNKSGSVAEWFKAAVLKTAAGSLRGGAQKPQKRTFQQIYQRFKAVLKQAQIALFDANKIGSRRHVVRHNMFLARSLPSGVGG